MRDLIKKGDVIRINSDMWDDAGKTFKVKKAIYRIGSTALELTLEGGEHRVVPYHIVEVVNDSI